MYFSFALAFAAALIGQAGALTTPTVTPVQTHVNAPASFPVSDLTISNEPSNRTLGHSESRLVARQEFPATLLLCLLTGCTDCSTFNLATFPEDECFVGPFDFVSVAISQPSNQGLPFEVTVGPAGCASLLQIPTVNECFNVNGAIFNDFALLV